MPARARKSEGEERRLGLELEFIGLDLRRTAEIVQKCFGGEKQPLSDYELRLEGTEFGDFQVELDFAYLKKMGREKRDRKDMENQAFALAENVMAEIARHLVPVEIVCPPTGLSELWRYNDLVSDLRRAGAKGTKHSPQYAFGVHMNPELPDLETKTILHYLQAFLCLYPWLIDRGEVDLSRRITPYIDPVGKKYLRLLMDRNYEPDLESLINDYLEFNPTRNRALDMLPLFAYLDEDRVRARVEDERIKSRPTLHYRLPNCQVDEAGWSLAQPWRDWLQVEYLANDTERLSIVRRAYRNHLDNPTSTLFGDWGKECARWLLPELM